MEQEKTVAELESELVAARSEFAKRQSESAQADATIKDISEKRGRLAALWKNEGDAAAKKELDAMRRAQFDAEQEREDCAAAAAALEEKIRGLETELSDARRREVEEQIAEEENALLSDSLMFDDGVGRLLLAREAIFARRDRLIALARQINADTARYEKIPTNMRRSISEQLFPHDPALVTKAAREQFSQPFSRLMESILRPEPNWIDITDDLLSIDAKRAS